MTPAMRVPPHSLEAERAVLGGVLLENAAASIALRLSPEDCYSAANGQILETMRDLHRASSPIDIVTLRAALVRANRLAMVGGDEYILSLTDTLPTVENVEAHVAIVRSLARTRSLITTCVELASMGYSGAAYEDLRAEAERRIRGITTEEVDGEPIHIAEVLAAAIRAVEEAKRRKGPVGLSTGLAALDGILGGYEPGRVYVVAGRPGMGKSSLTLATLTHAKVDEPILVFGLEMPNTETGQRLIVADSGLDLADLTRASLGRDAWRDIMHSTSRLSDKRIFFDDSTRTIEQITAKARRFHAKHGKCAALVIDYLQLIRGDRKLPREQQIAEVSRELKALAKELKCAVVLLSQLNRECESRPDKRPMLSDLRESGAIEQDADTVVFVFRPGVYAAQMMANGKPRKRGKWEPESDIQPGIDDGTTELIVGKQRGGRTGTVKVLFQGQSTRFMDLAGAHETEF